MANSTSVRRLDAAAAIRLQDLEFKRTFLSSTSCVSPFVVARLSSPPDILLVYYLKAKKVSITLYQRSAASIARGNDTTVT